MLGEALFQEALVLGFIVSEPLYGRAPDLIEGFVVDMRMVVVLQGLV